MASRVGRCRRGALAARAHRRARGWRRSRPRRRPSAPAQRCVGATTCRRRRGERVASVSVAAGERRQRVRRFSAWRSCRCACWMTASLTRTAPACGRQRAFRSRDAARGPMRRRSLATVPRRRPCRRSFELSPDAAHPLQRRRGPIGIARLRPLRRSARHAHWLWHRAARSVPARHAAAVSMASSRRSRRRRERRCATGSAIGRSRRRAARGVGACRRLRAAFDFDDPASTDPASRRRGGAARSQLPSAAPARSHQRAEVVAHRHVLDQAR